MGRHDDPNPAPFYTSLGSAVLRGLLALFLSFGVYAVLQTIRAGDQRPQTATLGSSEQPVAVPAPEPAPVLTPSEPVVDAQELGFDVEPSEEPAPAQEETLRDKAPSPKRTTVQVLDGGAGQRRTDRAADDLKSLGYRVVAVNSAIRNYSTTTVFYSKGREPAALGLQQRDKRFAAIGPNPNLSEEVDLHIVVGTDWR